MVPQTVMIKILVGWQKVGCDWWWLSGGYCSSFATGENQPIWFERTVTNNVCHQNWCSSFGIEGNPRKNRRAFSRVKSNPIIFRWNPDGLLCLMFDDRNHLNMIKYEGQTWPGRGRMKHQFHMFKWPGGPRKTFCGSSPDNTSLYIYKSVYLDV